MTKTILAAAAVVLSSAAGATVPQFEDVALLETRIGAFLAQASPEGTALIQPLDRRLRMARCPEPATVEMSLRDEVVVRCASVGWRLRVPVVVPVAARSAIVIRRGDTVELAVGGNGFDIVTSATALEDGREGGMLRVKSPTGASTMTARVDGPGRVTIAN